MLCANQSVTIRGLRCAKHGSALCAGNPWIVQLLRNPRIAQLTRAYIRVCGSLKRAGSCIMVDRNDFEEYLSSSFVQKKSGSKVISSLYTSLSSSATRQICSLLHTTQSKITVRMKNVQSQSGGNDCGLFAIAFAVCLCEGKGPCKFKWSQEHMRSLLVTPSHVVFSCKVSHSL